MGLRLRANNKQDNGRSIKDVGDARCCAACVMQSSSDNVGSVGGQFRYTGPARYREAVYSEGASLCTLVESSSRRRRQWRKEG